MTEDLPTISQKEDDQQTTLNLTDDLLISVKKEDEPIIAETAEGNGEFLSTAMNQEDESQWILLPAAWDESGKTSDQLLVDPEERAKVDQLLCTNKG